MRPTIFFGIAQHSFEDLGEEMEGQSFCLNWESGLWGLILGRRGTTEDEPAGITALARLLALYTQAIVLGRIGKLEWLSA